MASIDYMYLSISYFLFFFFLEWPLARSLASVLYIMHRMLIHIVEYFTFVR